MRWLSALLPASFRGVPFKVNGTEVSSGRRAALHQYPHRNTPYAEDLGRQSRSHRLDGWVIGDDVHQQRDTLLAACEQPGPGWLMHPYLGRLSVVCTGVQVQEGTEHGRVATFSMTFVESGEHRYPTQQADLIGQCRQGLRIAQAVSRHDFAQAFAVSGWPAFVNDHGQQTLSTIINRCEQWRDTVTQSTSVQAHHARAVKRTRAQLPHLLHHPDMLATTLPTLLSVEAASPREALIYYQHWLSVNAPLSIRDNTSPAAQQVYNNQQALWTLVHSTLLFGAMTVTLVHPLSTQTEARQWQHFMDSVFEPLLSVASDPLFRALESLQSRWWAAMPEITQLPRMTTRTLTHTTPSLVVAYRWYRDLDRAADIIQRNNITHPAFVPAQVPLHALSER